MIISIHKIYRFACRSYKKHHVSSPQFMLLGNLLSLSAMSMRSPKILVFVPSFSDVGEMLQTRRMFNSS